MQKLIDFDGIFEKKLAEYMKKNAGKHTAEEWEDVIPKLYEKFGDTFMPSLENTPKGYYLAMADSELKALFAAHAESGVPVSDFFVRALEEKRPDWLAEFVLNKDKAIAEIALRLLGNGTREIEVCLNLLRTDADKELKDSALEKLRASADAAKEGVLGAYERQETDTDVLLDILSNCKDRDDRVFEVLLKEFRTAADELPVRAGYLAAYGDERALPYLLECIDRDEVNFLEYRELKYAIEALGGEYARERDFANDPYYLEIDAQSQSLAEKSEN